MGQKDVVEGLPGIIRSHSVQSRLLKPGIPKKDIDFFVEAHNMEWSRTFLLDADSFRRRLDSGHLFVAAYAGDIPLGLLETIAIEVDESLVEQITEHTQQYLLTTFQVCELSPHNYEELTRPWLMGFKPSANVLWLVDITILPQYRRYGIASRMVDFVVAELLKDKQSRVEQLRNVNYSLTFTPSDTIYDIESLNPLFNYYPLGQQADMPSHDNSHFFHRENGAFYTWYLMKNARPSHMPPHVIPMCYLAPGYEGILQQKRVRNSRHT